MFDKDIPIEEKYLDYNIHKQDRDLQEKGTHQDFKRVEEKRNKGINTYIYGRWRDIFAFERFFDLKNSLLVILLNYYIFEETIPLLKDVFIFIAISIEKAQYLQRYKTPTFLGDRSIV